MQDFEADAERVEVDRQIAEWESLFADQLPDWAGSKLDGEWVQYAQLQTKDGRRMGNAVILAVDVVFWDDKPVDLHMIMTDFGTIVRMTESELAWQFHPPQWRMQADRVHRRAMFMSGFRD